MYVKIYAHIAAILYLKDFAFKMSCLMAMSEVCIWLWCGAIKCVQGQGTSVGYLVAKCLVRRAKAQNNTNTNRDFLKCILNALLLNSLHLSISLQVSKSGILNSINWAACLFLTMPWGRYRLELDKPFRPVTELIIIGLAHHLQKRFVRRVRCGERAGGGCQASLDSCAQL